MRCRMGCKIHDCVEKLCVFKTQCLVHQVSTYVRHYHGRNTENRTGSCRLGLWQQPGGVAEHAVTPVCSSVLQRVGSLHPLIPSRISPEVVICHRRVNEKPAREKKKKRKEKISPTWVRTRTNLHECVFFFLSRTELRKVKTGNWAILPSK